MEPLFERVILKVTKDKAPELFAEVVEKTKPTLHLVANDCADRVKASINKEVLFNGNISEVVEDNEEYQLVVTHQTNLLMFY
jgi:hypothetical protein